MPDNYISGGSSKSAGQGQVYAEWAELRPTLEMAVMHARHAIASLRDIPRPLYADEREKFDKTRQAFAEHVYAGLHDLMGDLIGPVSRRTDAAGMDTDEITVDLSEVVLEIDRLRAEVV